MHTSTDQSTTTHTAPHRRPNTSVLTTVDPCLLDMGDAVHGQRHFPDATALGHEDTA